MLPNGYRIERYQFPAGFRLVIRGQEADLVHQHSFPSALDASAFALRVARADRAPNFGDPKCWAWEADLSRLIEILDLQADRVQRPALKLFLDEGPVKLHVAGERSRRAGDACVTDGRPYGESRFYGWLDRQGNFEARADCPSWVREALFQFANDPQAWAANFGRAHGHCVFCEKELTDAVSVAFGYGPNCAKRVGLPHGKRAAKAAGLELPEAPVSEEQALQQVECERDALRHHDCREAGLDSWREYDAQGIYLDRVCDLCRDVKLAKYRPEILSGYSQADVDEPIEAEWGSDWDGVDQSGNFYYDG